jgi:hypothetical protein
MLFGCGLICFQCGGLHYYKEYLKGESGSVKIFQNNYDAAAQIHDENRKDALVKILLGHQPDRERFILELGNYFLFISVIFGLGIIGFNLFAIIRQKRLKPN